MLLLARAAEGPFPSKVAVLPRLLAQLWRKGLSERPFSGVGSCFAVEPLRSESWLLSAVKSLGWGPAATWAENLIVPFQGLQQGLLLPCKV